MAGPDDRMSQEYRTHARESVLSARDSCIARIEELGRNVDAATLFVSVSALLSLHSSMSESSANAGPARIEILAYHLFPLFGHERTRRPTPWDIRECIDAIEQLFTTQAIAGLLDGACVGETSAADELRNTLRNHAETVRGSAYPEQTSEEISEIQGHFEDWFRRKAGIGPTRAQEVLWAIVNSLETNLNACRSEIASRVESWHRAWTEARSATEKTAEQEELLRVFADGDGARSYAYAEALTDLALEEFTVQADEISEIDTPVEPAELEALVGLIGLTRENRLTMRAGIEVRHRPLFLIPASGLFLIDISNALDALWDRFDDIAASDSAFFQKYQKRKCRWTEDKVTQCLSKVFSPDRVFRNLEYPDPDRSDGGSAEVDVLVRHGPILLVAEVKSNQFRISSQLGDLGRLRTDLRKNVEAPFGQACRAFRYLSRSGVAEFKERHTGRVVRARASDVQRSYAMSVSLHHLANLATNLEDLNALGLFQDGEYPISLCTADLDAISEFCEGPDVLLHYIERRLQLQERPEDVIGGELDLYSAYLLTRLQASRVLQHKDEPLTGIAFVGLSDDFDKWWAYKRGDRDEPPDIRLVVHDEIRDILAELRVRDDDASHWIAFCLLDMPDAGHDFLVDALTQFRDVQLRESAIRRTATVIENVVVCVCAANDVAPSHLNERLRLRVAIEKYRREAAKAIGFAVRPLDTTRPFESAVWMDEPWAYCEEMEYAIAHEPDFAPAPGTKLPGRNDPCLCGSGRKYKRCCMVKVEQGSQRFGRQ